MHGEVNLILLGEGSGGFRWPLGTCVRIAAEPNALHRALADQMEGHASAACLLWDARLGPPDPAVVLEVAGQPGDLWHAGLRLGMAGLPRLLDFVKPVWMLHRDPDPDTEATSWRIGLRAALIPGKLLQHVGNVCPKFHSLEGAGLEWGYRTLVSGLIARHVPRLVAPGCCIPAIAGTCLEDEVRFVCCRFGAFWARWALGRAILAGDVDPLAAVRAWRRLSSIQAQPDPNPMPRRIRAASIPGAPAVTVLIPTIDRYRYLRTLLEQLSRQSVFPHEIIIVDQTPRNRRDTELAADFPSLPLKMIYLDQAGQCTSRNRGIECSSGEYILFLDDDDEIPEDLIDLHLRALSYFRADVSSGVSYEAGSGPPPEFFRLFRSSDVFPTNNTMIRRAILSRSGLFDLAYDRGQRADGDLGMRLYLRGAVMVLNPAAQVLHHHAPQGGLRIHRARVVTYRSSRVKLTHRQVPTATEIYLARRYFSGRQLQEMLWIRTLSTLSGRGSKTRRIVKGLVGLACLPLTCWQIRRNCIEARRLSRQFPMIPTLGAVPDEAELTAR